MQPTRPGRPDPRAQAQQAQLAASLAGAVDLAAVKARSDAAARAQAAPPPSAAAPAGALGDPPQPGAETLFGLVRRVQLGAGDAAEVDRAPSAEG